jgi:hypothetical protein
MRNPSGIVGDFGAYLPLPGLVGCVQLAKVASQRVPMHRDPRNRYSELNQRPGCPQCLVCDEVDTL